MQSIRPKPSSTSPPRRLSRSNAFWMMRYTYHATAPKMTIGQKMELSACCPGSAGGGERRGGGESMVVLEVEFAGMATAWEAPGPDSPGGGGDGPEVALTGVATAWEAPDPDSPGGGGDGSGWNGSGGGGGDGSGDCGLGGGGERPPACGAAVPTACGGGGGEGSGENGYGGGGGEGSGLRAMSDTKTRVTAAARTAGLHVCIAENASSWHKYA